jgi:hypothetical protein
MGTPACHPRSPAGDHPDLGERIASFRTVRDRRTVVRARPARLGEVPVLPRAPHGPHRVLREGYLPSVRIQPRAEFLHAVGPEHVLAAFHDLLDPELGSMRLSVSRLDLFADMQGWSLRPDDAHRFVCRADARRTHERGGTLTL